LLLRELIIDQTRYWVELSDGPFEEGAYVHYDRQARRIKVSRGLARQERIGLVAGLLLGECQKTAYQRAASDLLSVEVQRALRADLGVPGQQDTQGYKLVATPWDLDACFGVSPEFADPRLIKPSDIGLILRKGGGGSLPALAAWGAQELGAEASTGVHEAFWSSNVESQRCLVPATGWFDFTPDAPAMYLLASASLFAFAGVWGRVEVPGGGTRLVFTILRTGPEGGGSGVGGTMPVVLAPDEYTPWLDPASDVSALMDRVRVPWPKDDLIRLGLG
jgi:SOS response associated peptidase (SRAP)